MSQSYIQNCALSINKRICYKFAIQCYNSYLFNIIAQRCSLNCKISDAEDSPLTISITPLPGTQPSTPLFRGIFREVRTFSHRIHRRLHHHILPAILVQLHQQLQTTGKVLRTTNQLPAIQNLVQHCHRSRRVQQRHPRWPSDCSRRRIH